MQRLWPKIFSLKLLPEQGGNAGGFQSSEQDLCVLEQGEDILPVHWLNFTFKSLSNSRNKPQDVTANPHLCTCWLCFQKELILAIIPFFSLLSPKGLYFSAQTFHISTYFIVAARDKFLDIAHMKYLMLFFDSLDLAQLSFALSGTFKIRNSMDLSGHSYFFKRHFPPKRFWH